MDPIVPTPEQIASGLTEAKDMLADAPIPGFIKSQVTDEAITNAVTRLARAILNPPTS
jgi:hypothetical protein